MSFRAMLVSSGILQQKTRAAGGAGDSTATWTTKGVIRCTYEPFDSMTRLQYQKNFRDTTGVVYAETKQSFTSHLAHLLRKGEEWRIILQVSGGGGLGYYGSTDTRRRLKIEGAFDEQQRGRITVIEVMEVADSSVNA